MKVRAHFYTPVTASSTTAAARTSSRRKLAAYGLGGLLAILTAQSVVWNGLLEIKPELDMVLRTSCTHRRTTGWDGEDIGIFTEIGLARVALGYSLDDVGGPPRKKP